MSRRGRIWERGLLGVAVAWGVALPVGALLVPAYRGASVEMSGGTTSTTTTSATLVQVNGSGVLVTVSVPLAIAVAVTLLLSRRAPGRGPGVAATALIGLLAAGTVLAMMSIGIFVLPVTVCLALAWALRLAGAESAPDRPDRRAPHPAH
jgi:hypothetical protein